MSQIKIGLTGGIGSGKSTVAEYFLKLGAIVIDTDQIAREVVQKGSPALAKIVRHFGERILQSDGTLHRDALRRLVFSRSTEKKWLEDLLHPMIVDIANQRAETAVSHYCVLVIPLLVETQLPFQLDRVLVVDTTPALQRARLVHRQHLSEDEAEAIILSQATRAKRLSNADDVIGNAGDLTALRQQVDTLHQAYLQM